MNQYERNLSLLTEYFQNGCKENCSQKLGLEVEHFIVVKETGESVSFYGKHGVAELLERLKPCYSHFYYEGERLLGLYNSEYSLSLEPAAQLEISIAPRREISEIRNIYHSFRRQLEPILETWGYELVMLGYQPVSQIQDLSLIPKKRYDYMDAYFKKTGTMGAHMMRGTASTQISVDFFSERDFVRKMRAAYILMPMIKFLTDCSPIFEGKIQEKRMVRTRIWQRVDPRRCGIVPGLFQTDFGFASYARFLMQMPLIFVVEDGRAVSVGEQTAAQLWEAHDLTEKDIEHLLSMAFPDVRLKRYLEIRGADCMPFPYVMGYLALTKGIFYQESALEQILSKKVSEKEILEAERSLMEYGFSGSIYGKRADEYMKDILGIAREFLEYQEKAFLDPLEQMIEEKRSLTDDYEK